MTVAAALFQFYFDHFLPVDASWPPTLDFEIDGGRVAVAPRRPGDPLFPHPVDETLSTAELRIVPVSRPGGEITIRLRDRIIDRIQATVIHEALELEDDRLPDGYEDTATEQAITSIDSVIAHCRVLSEVLFLDGVRREYRRQDGHFYTLNPHTISWFSGTDPTNLIPLAVYEGSNATIRSGSSRVPERGTVSFPRLSESLNRNGTSPPLARSLLLLAEERIAKLAVREGILAAATALEVASERDIEQSGHTSSPDIRAILDDRSLSFSERRYDRLPQLLYGRSFRVEHQHNYEDIEKLYRSRNKAIHAGELTYREAGNDIQISERKAIEFVAAARVAIDWLETP